MWTLEEMMSSPSRWLETPGFRSDVILSTRVRIARNLLGHTFPGRADEAELRAVRDELLTASSRNKYLTNALVFRMEEASPAVRSVLVERHVASADLGRRPEGRAAIVGEREVASAMVNEEDHLRLSCIRSGLSPLDTWRLAERVDSEMDQNLHYAFSNDRGYLTACPTNVGTGLRVSVLAHVVGLVREGRIASVLGSVSKLGLSVRGYYGEGSRAFGGFFQISNQTTLGQSEEDVAYTVERVGAQIAELEVAARERLLSGRGLELADEVHRAYGVLSNARLLTADEIMERCSSLRLGVALGLLERVSMAVVNRLLMVAQPGHLAFALGADAAPRELDGARAELVRRELAGC